MADTHGLDPCAERRTGSSPVYGILDTNSNYILGKLWVVGSSPTFGTVRSNSVGRVTVIIKCLVLEIWQSGNAPIILKGDDYYFYNVYRYV